jgi:hypothetical protein
MNFSLAAEMLELMARELRDADAREAYWREYAFRLEEENGEARHLPRKNSDKTVTKIF